MQNVVVDILSSKLTPKARWNYLCINISIALVILSVFVGYLIDVKLYVKVILPICFVNLVFWNIRSHFIEDYEIIGKLIFESDQFIVQEVNSNNIYKVKKVKKIVISYDGYENEPYLTFHYPFISRSTGKNSTISFEFEGKKIEYKFSIINRTFTKFLNQLIQNYYLLGSDIKVKVKEKFVEF
jgi:hypothetical protein